MYVLQWVVSTQATYRLLQYVWSCNFCHVMHMHGQYHTACTLYCQADTEEDDDPWNDFAMGAAARSRPATATHHTPTPPSQAVAEGPSRGGIAPVAAAAATAANLVSGVVHHDDESDDYDDEDGARGAHCSDDESDGIGVEVF